jgi:hypothetical protein
VGEVSHSADMRVYGEYRLHIRFGGETGTEISRMAVFWVVAPCSLVEVYQRFRGPCCLHHQSPDRSDDGGSKDKRW